MPPFGLDLILDNENAIIRALRSGLMVGLAVGGQQAITNLTSLNVTHQHSEFALIAALAGALSGLDKWLRDWRSKNKI